MKFELFGKLRDNGNDNSSVGSDSPPSSNNDIGGGLGGDSNTNSPIGGGLEENVEQMFSQGYSEEEIRQELQGQYSENEIDQAVNRTIKSSATGGNSQQTGGPEPMTPYNGGDDTVSPMDEGYGQEDQEQQMNQNNQQPPAQGKNQAGGQPNPEPLPQQGNNNQNNTNSNRNGSVEEIVETIVAENLERVEREFESAYSEIDELKQKVEEIDERVHDLEVRDDEDQTQFIQKMDELEEDIDSYQARMGGLEKAFQQILPSLVDNVRDLTSLVQEIKQERGIETESNMNQDDIQDIDMEDW